MKLPTGFERVQRGRERFALVALRHLPPTRRPLWVLAILKATRAGSDSEYSKVVPWPPIRNLWGVARRLETTGGVLSGGLVLKVVSGVTEVPSALVATSRK